MAFHQDQAAGLAVVGAFAFVVVVLLGRRWRSQGRWVLVRRLALGVLAAWLILLGAIALRPLAPQPGPRTLTLVPFSGRQSSLELIANVVLFVPLGVAVHLLRRRARVITAVVAALAFSLGIETLQYVQHEGRSTDITDVLTNVAGAALGFVAASMAMRTHQSPARGRSTTGASHLTD